MTDNMANQSETETAVVVWVHGDCLSPHGPALAAYPDAPGLFVWDEALLHEWRISLKRVVFMYESLLELPMVIRRGDVAAQVAAFAREHGAETVATVESPSPRFAHVCARLRADGLRVEILDVAPLIDMEEAPDLRRFSRYWRTAKEHAFGRR